MVGVLKLAGEEYLVLDGEAQGAVVELTNALGEVLAALDLARMDGEQLAALEPRLVAMRAAGGRLQECLSLEALGG